MPRFTSPTDGAQLFYRDYKPASFPAPYRPILQGNHISSSKPALVFLHGNPMSSLAYESLMVPLCESYRFRCIAPDRRGFGKSDWNGDGDSHVDITYEVLAADTANLIEKLRLGPFVFVANSLGAGESVLAYTGSTYVRDNCKGFIWIGAVLPHTVSSPESTSTFVDSLRTSRADTIHALLPSYVMPQGDGKLSDIVLSRLEKIIDAADALAVERCTWMLAHRDFTPELKWVNENSHVPILCLHGDSDPAMPFEAVKQIHDIIPRSTLKKYVNGGHVIQVTEPQKVMEDIVDFTEALHLQS